MKLRSAVCLFVLHHAEIDGTEIGIHGLTSLKGHIAHAATGMITQSLAELAISIQMAQWLMMVSISTVSLITSAAENSIRTSLLSSPCLPLHTLCIDVLGLEAIQDLLMSGDAKK